VIHRRFAFLSFSLCTVVTAWCAAFTPEGRYLAVGLGNGTIAVLRVPALPPDYVRLLPVMECRTP
jgi:hypothetical protein